MPKELDPKENELDPKQLRDNPARIAQYLSEALSTDDLPIILGAFRDVLRAQNVSAFAREAGLRRDKLYRTFGGVIDPDFSRVLKLLEGTGVQFTVKERTAREPKPPRPKLGRPRKKIDSS
jgi:probable addiction module antidote protein